MVLILHFFLGRKNYLQYNRDDRRTFDVSITDSYIKKVTHVQFGSSLKVTEGKKIIAAGKKKRSFRPLNAVRC